MNNYDIRILKQSISTIEKEIDILKRYLNLSLTTTDSTRKIYDDTMTHNDDDSAVIITE